LLWINIRVLFGHEDRPSIRLKPDFFFSDEEKVRLEENKMLIKEFFKEEIMEAVFGSYDAGAKENDARSMKCSMPSMFQLTFWLNMTSLKCSMPSMLIT
jgi:hypothetical protein